MVQNGWDRLLRSLPLYQARAVLLLGLLIAGQGCPR